MDKDNVTIAKHFIKATEKILKTMAQAEASVGQPFVKKNGSATGDISAIIGVTGQRNGSISVTFSRDCALHLAQLMLCGALEDEENDMKDTVGELANMVSGQARATLAEEGITMQGSTPSIVSGPGHTIEHKAKGPAIGIPFDLDGKGFIVEFCLES